MGGHRLAPEEQGDNKLWADLHYEDEDKLRTVFGGEPKNIGVKLGEPSGDLVVVDLDVPEAIALAPLFLPRTGSVSGRPGKPRSHWHYVAEGTPKRSFGDVARKAALVEVLSTGQQAIMPPSVHPSGERYGWDEDGEMARADAEDLMRACGELATATLVARHLPEDNRHGFAMALFGFLMRPGRLDDETALKIAKAAWDAAGYPEGKSRSEARRDLAGLASDTAEKLEEDGEVQGGPILDEYAPGLPKAIAKVWGWKMGKEQKPSQAEVLVGLSGTADLFHDPDGEPYATFPVGDHRETHRLKGKGFRRWLQKLFYEAEGKPVGSQALNDALGALEGLAIFDGAERETHVRLAGHGGNVYLDLCNPQWEVVEIAPSGWRVIPGEKAPVRFRRAGGMRPLPYPSKDGDLSGLRRLLNLPDDREESWRLVVAWLVAALRPEGPYPVLILQGEQGSAKSSAQRILRALVDPSTVPLRTAPREERDLMIAATNGWVVAFDNLSGLPGWLSDGLCRLSTGGGFGTRTLYSDAEETLFSATRPVMMNGITDVAGRPDLVDRSLIVELPTIPEERRKTEREVNAEFERAHPAVLGALLDAVGGALGRLPETKLERLPRMAEFAEWATAAEEGLGWEKGAFMNIYQQNRAEAVDAALEGDPVAEAVLAFMGERRGWEGTTAGLQKEIALKADERVQRTKDWPKTPAHLSARMKRLAPALRAQGLEWEAETAGDKVKTRMKRLFWREGFGPSKEDVAAASEKKRRPSRGGLLGPAGDDGEGRDEPEGDGSYFDVVP
ncbi:MAG: bifunctional DNA primase/polymerase [Actinomycetota bacterium]|nr:bifunctional DNA primase/polymerase [Actinomycetota bacterium]